MFGEIGKNLAGSAMIEINSMMNAKRSFIRFSYLGAPATHKRNYVTGWAHV